MKTFYEIVVTFISLFLAINGVQAQSTQTGLDQIKMMQQLTGSWKAEIAKDTIALWEIKSTGTALDCSYQYMTGGNILFEGKQEWEYDKKTDKNIGTQMTNGKKEPIGLAWFISKNKYIMVSPTDNANPDKIYWKIEGEFKDPDTFVQTNIVNDKPTNTVIFKRVK